jgi:lipoprotein-releasing system permease protein
MGLISTIALAHIAGRARQTLVAVIGVAVGVGFSIAIAALMQGSQNDFIKQLIDTMPHVLITDRYREAAPQAAEQVFDAVRISGLRPRDDRRGIINPTEKLAWLEGWLPGRLAPSLRAQGAVRFFGRDVSAALIGIEPEKERGVSPIVDDFVAGSFDALQAGGDAIAVGDRMLIRLGASLGDIVTVVSSSGFSRSFRIAGVFHTGTTARDESEAYMLLRNAQIVSERPNAINQITIKLRDPYSAPAAAQRIEAAIGYQTQSWQEANEPILEALVIRNIIMYTVVAAIMLVAGFGIYNIVSTITHEKSRDIAIMKSLGFTAGDMQRIFLLEGVAIGSVGSLVGWLLGLGLVYALWNVPFKLSASGQELTHLPVAWNFLHYILASGFAISAAAVAALLPSRRAARVNPVDIIRGAT